jgi:hypothetical protein
MKTLKTLVAGLPMVLLAAASQSALAEGAVYEYPQRIVSTASSADVAAQAVAARRAGTIARGEADYELPQVVVASGLTRAQVIAEAIESRRLGLIPVGDAPAKVPSAAELEQVRLAGLNAARLQMAAKR